jgi:lipopolysaccharide transport system ATP-binding protein
MTGPNVSIAAEGLGKKYLIGHESADQSRTLRDAISGSVRNFGRSAMNMMRGEAIIAGAEIEEFWALRNLDFTIEKGDVIGVIGRNGAGKSTLLKVLSRITEPSEGRVTIRGRVASLLEVGTGFHPELSGRENIFLNGAILGMTRGEIRRKFDEIVDFAEVERFLDTPVKRYSSGMYVRLAFAVAAHLEPEILIVDEVLAVGDAEFQKKCLGKMHDVANEGRTVIFVSHNMAAIRMLCQKGIFLKQGCTNGVQDLDTAVTQYLESGQSLSNDSSLVENPICKLKIEYCSHDIIRISGSSSEGKRPNFTIGVALQTLMGTDVFETGSADHVESSKIGSHDFAIEFRLPAQDLRPGQYILRSFAYLQNEKWLIGKEDGPHMRIELPSVPYASPPYFNRPAGYGPVIKWHKL